MMLQLQDNLTQTNAVTRRAHLLAGLAVADVRLQRAITAARAGGFGELTDLRGLFVSDEHVDRLLRQSPGSPLWQSANGRSPHTPDDDWQAALKEARHRWQTITQNGRLAAVPLPLDLLIRRFHLSPLQTEALLLTLLPEFDLRYEPLLAYLQDDMTRKRPSVNLLLDLLAKSPTEKLALRDLFAANGRLRHTKLITCAPPAGQPDAPLLAHAVQPAASVVEFLLGQTTLDPALGAAAALQNGLNVAPPPHLDATTVARLQQANESAPVFLFYGPYGSGKRETAAFLAAVHNRPLLTLSLPDLLAAGLNLAEGVALALRDGRLHAAVLHFTGWDAILHDDQPPEAIWQQALDYPHTVIITGSESWQPRRRSQPRPIHAVSFAASGAQSRLSAWQQQLDADSDAFNLPPLANLFRLTPGQITDAAATARDLARWRQEPLQTGDLYAAARLHSNQRLSRLAVRLSPRHRWEEIILPADPLAQLRELVQRVQNKPTVYGRWQFDQKLSTGKGIAALFAGESGTGKTMAAGIIAGALGLDLYKIDLSAVVSKYIGETEKNLERIFSEATTSNAILFFDEADAIFGKRGEVNDSHDRYANLEVSYLLQRMERFDGIVILASNLQTNIDDAFTRRLDFIIEFPFPQKAERARIWQVSLPPALPLAEPVDFELLAERFELSGGNIRNAVLGAAFLAAAEDTAVHLRHFLHAARREYQKLGRLIDESLFALPQPEEPAP